MFISDLPSRVFLAPMAGITDRPLRRLTASLGGGNLVSEMAAVNAIVRQNAQTCRLIDVRQEPYPVTVQLVGGDPDLFAEAAAVAADFGAAGIDINMGCPVRKIVSGQAGSYLMTDMPRAAQIIKAVKSAVALPVSVKFRKGWDNAHVNAVDFAKMCEDCGAAYVTVHGRTRAAFYAGAADWDIIGAVKAAVKIPVIGNGDVDSPQKAAQMLAYTGADGVMIGRAALGQPWLIAQTQDFLERGIAPTSVSIATVKQILLTHIKELQEYYGDKLALGLSRKYVCWYCKNMPAARKFRETYVHINNMPEALAAINGYFDSCAERMEQ